MATDERIAKYEDKMNKTMEALVKELGTIRAGRANPHILDKITVLWGTYTSAAGGKCNGTGTQNDSDPAVGVFPDQRHPESYPDI